MLVNGRMRFFGYLEKIPSLKSCAINVGQLSSYKEKMAHVNDMQRRIFLID